MTLSFEEALVDSAGFARRHLLLGNGFSIACRGDVFHYGSLFNQADFSACPEVVEVFESLDTHDFEFAIRSLESAAKIAPIYAKHGAGAADVMLQHAAALKEVLLQTIAGQHPDLPNIIPDEKYHACRSFLTHFLGTGGQVFTLNYDLLLYWTLMHTDVPVGADPVQLENNDGFGNQEDDPGADYVVWQGETGAHSAKVHFLHGAMHLFDSGSELKKYTWVRTGIPLVEQAREALESGFFPLFVAEGTSTKKKAKIRHNAYLYQGLKQLNANATKQNACFFIFGHSLAANDDHILTRLARARFPKLYVGLFGDPGSATNREIKRRAESLPRLRARRYPLEIVYYDSASAKVWGE
ncbi:MAG: DUF4917 family protein [Pseudomonadota bacterium]|nr:DUF4917 family protein [Pseudomonadota bacterium]